MAPLVGNALRNRGIPSPPLLARGPVRELGLHAAIPECRRPRCTARPRSQDGKAMTVTAAAPAGAVTRQLAEFLATASQDDLPPDVLHETYRATLDWFGSALAGALEPPARFAQGVARSLGVSSDATMLGAGRASAAAAAFANGVASHILELDDVHKGSTLHAAAPVIPAALGDRRARASERPRVLARGRGRVRRRLAHWRSRQSESLPLLASDWHRRDVRRCRSSRLAAPAHRCADA